MPTNAKQSNTKPPRPKRYYRRRERFPDGVDRLEGEVCGPVTEEQISRWVDELFLPLKGGMKATVGYVILKHGAWEAAMNVGMGGGLGDGDNRGDAHSVDSSKTAFRATWALEWAYEWAGPGELPEWFFDRMARDFARSANGSLHRVYAKMLCDRMRFGGVRPSAEQAGQLAERCFELVIDPATKTAVRFWCLEILADLAPRVEWVAAELEATLRHISEAADCPPGMRVVTRELLRRIATLTHPERISNACETTSPFSTRPSKQDSTTAAISSKRSAPT